MGSHVVDDGADGGQEVPRFAFGGRITDPASLAYAPTGEFIFPSVIEAGAHFSDPLGRWYLYYSPHEAPGGIALMYSDSLEGPWTEHPSNPLIRNEWGDHYAVSHVASPDVMWNSAEQLMFLYFHGENDTTRYATSRDGIAFSYGGVAVEQSGGSLDVTESSYARVFANPDVDAGGYVMLFMDNTAANHRRIRIAHSPDGRRWVVRSEPLISPGGIEGANVSSANLWLRDGRCHVVYHGSSGEIFIRDGDPSLSELGTPRVLYRGDGRVASPEIVDDAGRVVMFFEAGARTEAAISFARLIG